MDDGQTFLVQCRPQYNVKVEKFSLTDFLLHIERIIFDSHVVNLNICVLTSLCLSVLYLYSIVLIFGSEPVISNVELS